MKRYQVQRKNPRAKHWDEVHTFNTYKEAFNEFQGIALHFKSYGAYELDIRIVSICKGGQVFEVLDYQNIVVEST